MNNEPLKTIAQELARTLHPTILNMDNREKRGFIKDYVYRFVSHYPERDLISYDLYCAACRILARDCELNSNLN